MLAQDIRYALFLIRQATYQDEEFFEFLFQFTLDKDETDAVKEKKKVNLNALKARPYIWVENEMQKQTKANKGKNGTKYPWGETKFPKMYENYAQMLKENKNRVWLFPSKNIPIEWEMLTGDTQFENKGILETMGALKAALEMRHAMVERTLKDTDQKMKIKIEWDEIPAGYSDKFRSFFLNEEGYLDATITVKSDNNPDKQEMINLMDIPAFFVPSLGG
jgi:hypothetical protein